MSNGHRVRGGISGAVCGLGMAVLAQQFGVVPLTVLTVVLIPLGMALVGVAIGWPRPAGSPVEPRAQARTDPRGGTAS